ncbi:MAG: metal-dependent hydrolase [Spirochaetales bacterium]|nr:metal-dependent hydrolase [Spirochaetales bacterium]
MALSITFLGHSGFRLSDGRSTLLVDPFLTGNPVATHTPEALDCTHIALTHGHGDHIGDTVAIAKRTGATVIAAFEIAEYSGEEGLTKLEPGNPGGTITTEFGTVTFTHAFHSSSYNGRYMGMPCGLVIEMGGIVLYHAGDTGIFSDMRLIGEIYKPVIAALPIGDRFTMGPELASRAAEMIKPKYAIPIHYKTFPPLRQSAEGFSPAGVEVHVMEPGDTWEL